MILMPDQKRILVIKHGALGDVVQATGPFAAIRRHHADGHITLLTTPPFAEMSSRSPYFDEVWIDRRPSAWRIGQWIGLRRRLIKSGFHRVYDLQTSQRTGLYFRMLPKDARPEWSGMATGCSLPHANPDRDKLHTVERQADQLRMAGLTDIPPPSLDWLCSDISHFALPDGRAEHSKSKSDNPSLRHYTGYVLLIAGGSTHRPGKRWPAERFGELAVNMVGRGLLPVLIGTSAEKSALRNIHDVCPQARDLCGSTSLADLADLARRARYAVANDTGPAHIAAVAGCPTLVLFSGESDPKRCAPRGAGVQILQRAVLSGLSVDEVEAALRCLPRPAWA